MNLCKNCEYRYMKLLHNEVTDEYYIYYYCNKEHESNFGVMFRDKCEDFEEEHEYNFRQVNRGN